MSEVVLMIDGKTEARITVPSSRTAQILKALEALRKKEDEKRMIQVTKKLFPWLFFNIDDIDFTDPIPDLPGPPPEPIEEPAALNLSLASVPGEGNAMLAINGTVMALNGKGY
ncbi:MAG: hypothetical protein QNJ16_17070 [Rhodobacter sp.]|nr:hypothetical protein [Rhodobacter sp.]